jgi:hypothetical protein
MAKQFTRQTTLPFARGLGSPAANHLLVTFPKLHPGGTPPKSVLHQRLAVLDAHRLTLGSDEHTFVGPRRELRGLNTAAKLIGVHQRHLEVPRERTVAVGTSMGAVCALFVGLRARAGWIIAGGPTVRMGTWLERFSTIDGPSEAARAKAADLIRLVDDGDGQAVRFLDTLILKLARRVEAPTRIDLFVGPRDPAHDDVARFARELEDIPLVTATLTVHDYGTHRGLAEAFDPWAIERLGDLGRIPLAQATQKSFSNPMENGQDTALSASR